MAERLTNEEVYDALSEIRLRGVTYLVRIDNTFSFKVGDAPCEMLDKGITQYIMNACRWVGPMEKRVIDLPFGSYEGSYYLIDDLIGYFASVKGMN